MRISENSVREGALATLTAAVAAHQAGGEVSARLQQDWSDGAGLPTIVVRVGNRVTIRQGGTFQEASQAMLAWISRESEPLRVVPGFAAGTCDRI